MPKKVKAKELTYVEADHKMAYYLMNVLPLANMIKQSKMAVKALKNYEFDAIAFTGLSGALTAIPVSLALKKPLIAVRKPRDDRHSSRLVEGYIKAKTYIILDDFVASGATARRIYKAIKEFSPNAKCLGVLEVSNINDIKLAKYKGKKYPLDKAGVFV